MSKTVTERKPTDVLAPNPNWWCWHPDGWECAPEGSVRDARICTRGQAAGAFSRETTGYLPDVRVWKRYAVAWTQQDAWDSYGRDRVIDDYSYDHSIEYEEAEKMVPEVVPPEYDPDGEETPVWEFVHSSHPRAIPVWICGVKGDSPPQKILRRSMKTDIIS